MSKETGVGPNVLIVDDNEMIQEFLAEVYTTWGPFSAAPCTIRRAGSVAEAIAALQERAFDLIVLDMVLGDGNGLQVLGSTQRLDPRPPVIVVSADDPPDLRRKCAELGASAFLRKGDGVEAIVRESMTQLDLHPGRAVPRGDGPDGEATGVVGRILVVDDDPLVCDALASMMEMMENVDVRSATGGRTGLAIARDWEPHIILLDIAMPDMDGRQTLQQITESGLRSRVIMVSAFRDADIAKECVELGAVDYVPKPVDFPFLERAVTGHLALAKKEATLNETE